MHTVFTRIGPLATFDKPRCKPRSEDREMNDNQGVEEAIPRNKEDIGPEVRAAIK